MRKILTRLATVFVFIAVLALAGASAYGAPPPAGGNTTIVRVYYTDSDTANKIIISFEAQLLETNYEQGYHVLEVTQQDIKRLEAAGLTVQEDKTWEPGPIFASPTDRLESIPNYTCYRTVEETFASAQALAANHPNLATWTDQGDSWQKSVGLSGYDMGVLILTNSAIPGPKPKLFVTGAIHAREYSTAEIATRFGEYLVNNYGVDADATWILDYHEVHLMLQTNPDGRKKAETGLSWRKNTNQNYCGATSNYRGADLNRNFGFQWGCCGGSSTNPCDLTYRGPAAASEPETQAVQDYLRAIFPDQRGPNLTDAAPADAMGVYVDLHSYAQLVLWPWGFTSNLAPNATALQTLGRKFAYWNGYSPEQAIGLYPTDGTTDDMAYGELGIAAYCFEVGTAFFEPCSSFENTVLPANLPPLIYAAKVARTPYLTPAGPDALSLALDGDWVLPGTLVNLSATINDTRYRQSNGTEPTQAIAGAEYYVDTPPWVAGATAVAMSATDGSFNTSSENVGGAIDTTGWSDGKHILFVRGNDANNNWGAVTAIFLNVTSTPNQPPTAAFSFTTSNLTVSLNASASSDSDGTISSYAWNYGDGGTGNGVTASHTYAAAGTYNVTLTVTDNRGGSDAETQPVIVTAPAVPNAPTGLAATAVSRTQINLAWTDNSTNETGFKIERCKGSTCTNFAQIATVSANVTTYANTGLTKNTTYRYRVRAYNAVGNSGYSNIAAATTPR